MEGETTGLKIEGWGGLLLLGLTLRYEFHLIYDYLSVDFKASEYGVELFQSHVKAFPGFACRDEDVESQGDEIEDII